MAFKYTEEQLNKLDKELLIQLFLGLQDQMEELTKQTQALNDKMQLMMEQIVLSNKSRFGRSSEKMTDPGQIRFMEVDGKIVFFNEAEAVCDLTAPEPDDLELRASKKKKQTGKKNEDLSGIPVQRIDHYMTEEELTAEFGEKGWKQLPDAISRCYRFVPAKVEVEEHHIGVYASKTDEHMVKAPHPKNLLRGSLAILEGTYNCIEDELKKELVPYNMKIEPAEVWSPFFFRWQFMCDWNVFETCGDFINIASKIIGNERLMKKIIDDKIDYVLPVNYKELSQMVRGLNKLFGVEFYNKDYYEEVNYLFDSLVNGYHINMSTEEVETYCYQLCNYVLKRIEGEHV